MKKIALGVGIASLALLASACGGSSGGTTASSASAPSEAPAASAAPASSAPAAAAITFDSAEAAIPIGYPEPESGSLKLAYLNPFGGNEFLDTLGTAMQIEAEKLGGTVTVFDGKGSVDDQIGHLEQVIAQGYDGAFVFALDPNSMKPALAKAKEAGIALVTIDENFTSDDIGDYSSQILQRRDEAAFLGAQQMASLVAPGASIGTMDFAIAVPSIVFSIEMGKKWATAFGLSVAGNVSNPTDDIAGGEIAGTELLANYPDIAGIIAYNDPSAIGASAAAKSQGISGLIFGGQNGGSDALEAVKGGRINYTIQLDAPSMGKFATWGLYDIVQGVDVPKTVKAGDPKLVTTDNVGEAMPWSAQLEAMQAG